MPRKTKEEKIIAAYRRRLSTSQKSVESKSFTEEKTKKIEEPVLVKKLETKPKDTQDLYFKKDLLKSLLFIGLIITLEIIIYFARIKIY